ncbi:unnamed protein product, partial [Mesorhabditis spiculigera]
MSDDEPSAKKPKISDLEAERKTWENDQVWHARRTFLESHWNDLPLENLRCLSQVFINVNMIGCEYNPGVMEKIKELGAGIMDKARRLKNERAFVKASVGRKHANEIREQTEAERRPTVEQRKANRTPFEDKLIQLRAHLQIADLHSTPLQKLNTACARQQMQWQYVDKIDGAELRMNDHLICKRKFSREGFDRKEEMISTVVEAIAQAESMSVVEKELFFGEPPNVRGPYDCYEDSICRRFTRVSRHMNGKAPSMANLSEAMAYHGLAMKHDMQPTKRWEQKLVVHCGDVLLAERILKKEDCIASKTQQIIAEVAKQIIRSISVPKLVKGGDESLSLKLE